MGDRIINVGAIGMGKMGILHAGIVNSFENTKLRAISDNQDVILNFIKSALPSIGIYKNYEEMFDKEDLDLIYITTPTSYHIKIIEYCLDRGVNFFVEKPLGISERDCRLSIRKAHQKPVINMVGYCKHFVDTFVKAKEIIDSGALGDLTYVTSHMYVSQQFSEGSSWRFKKTSSGGGVLNILATHLVDILLWFFGDIKLVNSNIRSYYSKEVEDFVHSYIIFKNGLEGYLDASWSIRNYRLPEIKIEVQGKNGMLVVNDDYIKYSLDKENKFYTFYKQDLYKGVEIDIGGPEYTREDQHIIECIRNKKQTALDIFYSYKVQCITDSIYISASTKQPVEVNYRRYEE